MDIPKQPVDDATLTRPDLPGATPSPSPTQTSPGQGPSAPAARAPDLSFLAPAPRPDLLGMVGVYEIVRVLGHGGMGIVFEANDPTLRRRVAIKVMAPELAAVETARLRFLREARNAAAVKHPSIVPIHAVDEFAGLPYLVMHLVDGPTLAERLERDGPLPVADAVRVAAEVAEGLAAAHTQGLVHRDVKPANILLSSDVANRERASRRVDPGGPERPEAIAAAPVAHAPGSPRSPSAPVAAKLTDFGLARAADDTSLTRTGAVAGTPTYMAPEQARGERVDPRADLFSLGTILYEMLAGRPPFHGAWTLDTLRSVCDDEPASLTQANPAVPSWLETLVRRLHAKDPARRLGPATQVAWLLRQGLSHLRNPDVPAPIVPEAPPPRRRRRGPWLAAALVLLAGLAVGGWALFGRSEPEDEADAGLVRAPQPGPGPDPGPDPGPGPGPAPSDWTSLSGGADLSAAGWRRDPRQPADWQLKDGEIVVTGATSHLYTIKEHFADFHLRLEAQLEPGDDSALFVRCGFGPQPAEAGWFPDGYAVRLGDDPTASRPQSGSLLYLAPAQRRQARAGQWLKIEVIAEGNRLRTLVNGEPAVDFVDPQARYRRGRLALQKAGRGTRARFRKIEVRLLPGGAKDPGLPERTADPPPRIVFRAGPETPVVAKAGVRRDGDAWQVERNPKNSDPVPLFELDRPDFAGGRLACRFQLRSDRATTASVRLAVRYPDRPELVVGRLPLRVTADWSSQQEVSFFHQLPGLRPEKARIEVLPEAGAPVWLREVRLEQEAPTEGPREVEVRRPRPVELAVEHLATLAGHLGPIFAVALAPDGQTLVSGGQDGQVVFWSPGDGRWQKRHTFAAGPSTINALAFSKDGNTLAAACHDARVRLWRRQGDQWREASPLTGCTGPVLYLAWSPDGTRLAAGDHDTTPPDGARVRVWDVGQGKELFALGEGKIQAVRGLQFRPDGKQLGVGWGRSAGPGIEWYNTESRRVEDSHNSVPPIPWADHFLPDGRQVGVSTNNGNQVGVWRQESAGWPGMWLGGHTALVRALAISPDGTLLASGSQDRTVRLRDLDSGLDLAVLRGHQAEVLRLAFSGDSGLLATAGVDAVVKLWRITRSPAPGPFVVLARGARPESSHPSLAAAVLAATAGDVIEVRGNGPFLTNGIVVRDKALTIRAGLGYWPLIATDPQRERGPYFLISSNADLTLEGLELHRALVREGGPSEAMVHVRGAALRLAHCRLVARRDAEAIHCEEPKRFEALSSILLPENAPAVSWSRPSNTQLVIDNSLVAGHGLVVRDTRPEPPLANVSLRIARTTVIGPRAVELRVSEPMGKPPLAPAKPGLRVRVDNSVLDTAEFLVALRPLKDPTLTAPAGAYWLSQRLGWSDRGSLLRTRGPALLVQGTTMAALARLPDLSLAEWDNHWGQKDTGSRVGRPTYSGVKDNRPDLLHYGLLPEHVRGLGVGAASDRLGPGSPYWRWRESAAYERWEKPPAR